MVLARFLLYPGRCVPFNDYYADVPHVRYLFHGIKIKNQFMSQCWGVSVGDWRSPGSSACRSHGVLFTVTPEQNLGERQVTIKIKPGFARSSG